MNQINLCFVDDNNHTELVTTQYFLTNVCRRRLRLAYFLKKYLTAYCRINGISYWIICCSVLFH